MHSQDIGDTLAQVNIVRSAFGMQSLHELPYANMGDPAACLFYRALSDCGAKGVHGDAISFNSDRQAALVADLWGVRRDGSRVNTPKQMKRMISSFDSAEFPAYGQPGDRFSGGPFPTYEDESDESDDGDDEDS
jgi:hypothetical protein